MRRPPYPASHVALSLIVPFIALTALSMLTPARPLAASPMIFAHAGHSATRFDDGRVLVAGGGANSAEIYDPATDRWTLADAMRVPRQGHAAVLLEDGRVLVVGGNSFSQIVEVYNPATDRWAQVAPLHVARGAVGATLLNDGRVLVVGGASQDASIEIYDPVANAWTLGAPYPNIIGSSNITAITLHDGRVLVAGGYLGYGNPLVLYDSGTDRWKVISMGIYSPTQAALLPDGRVLILSSMLIQPPNVAFLFNPSDDSVRPAAPRPCVSMEVTFTPLPDGRVLTLESDGNIYRSCNILYDVASDRWVRTAALAQFRASFTATLLHDSVVLVAGGIVPPTGPVVDGSSELYDAAAAAMDESTYLPMVHQKRDDVYPFPPGPTPIGTPIPTVTPYIP